MFTDIRRVLTTDGSRAVIILLAVLNILFFPCIWGNKTLLDSAQLVGTIMPDGAWAGNHVQMGYAKTLDWAAPAWLFEPSLAFTGFEYWKEKVIPLWNPYQGYGTPFAADMQSQPFYPLVIALSIHLTPFTYNLFVIARLFIAGLCSYWFLKMFVSFTSAVAGAIATMLSGYYLLYITMPHISVEILLPAALLVAEYLLRTKTYRSVVAFSGILFLVIVGGMPESTALVFGLLYSYIIFRIISNRHFRSEWIRLTSRVVVASVAGLCLSAVTLLPFWEFLRHSFNAHEPSKNAGIVVGLFSDKLSPYIFSYLFPLLFGQIAELRNYSGLVALFLAVVAVLTVVSRKKGIDNHLTSLTSFFFMALMIVLLRRYGIVPFKSIGALPLFRYISFYKYEELIVSVCIAILVAVGVERLLNQEASVPTQVAALGISFAMAPLGLVAGQKIILNEVRTKQLAPQLPELAIGISVVALFCVALSLLVFGPPAMRAKRGLCIVALLAAELSANYIAVIYYLENNLPTQAENAYLGAPYIKMLKLKSADEDRVFARDGVLYPDWASVFGLYDIRNLDAMYYKKYLPFVQNFLRPRPTAKQELVDRFTGDNGEEFAFNTNLQKRLLQLSSVRYLATIRPYNDPTFVRFYDHEVKLYSYNDVLPRASLYYQAEVEANERQVLKRLADPQLNVFQTVLLDATKLKSFQVDQVKELNIAPVRCVEPATIVSYRSQTVEIQATVQQPAVLMLNDADYPGWAVQIDGASGKWFTADYLFRAVMLQPGKHVVRFVYQSRAFYEGIAITAMTLMCMGFYGVFHGRRRSKTEPSPA